MQKHQEALTAIVQLFYGQGNAAKADGVRSRLSLRTQAEVLGLVRASYDSWRTKQYDFFQQKSNNIFY